MFQCEKKIIVDGLRTADHVGSRPDQLSTGDEITEQSSEVHFRLKEVLRGIIQVLNVDKDADPLFFVLYEHSVREYRCPASRQGMRVYFSITTGSSASASPRSSSTAITVVSSSFGALSFSSFISFVKLFSLSLCR